MLKSTGLFQKKKQTGGWGIGISRGIEKTKCAHSRGQKKGSRISRGDQEKIVWNFHGSWVLALDIPMGETQFWGISGGEASFPLKFPGVKWQI